MRRLHSRTPNLLCQRFTTVSSPQPCARALLAANRTRRPTRALQLKSRVDVRVAARHRASVPTPDREDRLPAHHETPRHVGSLDWEHRRREGQRVSRGRSDAGEQEAKISRDLAADDEVRDDSCCLFLSGSDVMRSWPSSLLGPRSVSLHVTTGSVDLS